jgi:solute carrier family 25 folate transporter 32
MYRGLSMAVFGTSHGALQFMAYEKMKNYFLARNAKNSTSSDRVPEMVTYSVFFFFFFCSL